MARYPSINLKKVDKTCSEVYALLNLARGRPLDSTLISKFIDGIDYALVDHIPSEYIQSTLLQYVGKSLTPAWCQLLARQLSARKDELKVRPLLPFDRPTHTEWVPIEIIKLTDTVWNETKSGQLLTFFCLAGSPAGYTLKRKFPTRWLAWLAYQIGFTRRMMYQDDPQIFVGMRVWALIGPSEDPQQTMDITDWDVSPAMKKHNKTVAYRRLRFDLKPSLTREGEPGYGACPYDLDDYCHACPKTASECAASYKRMTQEREPTT